MPTRFSAGEGHVVAGFHVLFHERFEVDIREDIAAVDDERRISQPRLGVFDASAGFEISGSCTSRTGLPA